MSREALASGSLGGLVLSALVQSLSPQSPAVVPVPSLNPPPLEPLCALAGAAEDWPEILSSRSFWIGLLCGVALGPAIDLLYCARVWWRQAATRWFSCEPRLVGPFPLYREHEPRS